MDPSNPSNPSDTTTEQDCTSGQQRNRINADASGLPHGLYYGHTQGRILQWIIS